MPKELQLQILGDFRGIPTQVRTTDIDQFGKLEREGRVLHRFRVGDYRIVYQVISDENALLIFRIGHRREIYS